MNQNILLRWFPTRLYGSTVAPILVRRFPGIWNFGSCASIANRLAPKSSSLFEQGDPTKHLFGGPLQAFSFPDMSLLIIPIFDADALGWEDVDSKQ